MMLEDSISYIPNHIYYNQVFDEICHDYANNSMTKS